MTIHWKYLDLSIQWNIRLFDCKLGVPWSTHWVLHILINSPVTVTSQLQPLFVKKSTFASRYIVHPTGGGAARLVCESCGAEYPYVANPSPCAFCAVMKESGITVCVAHRTMELRWSDWGWAVICNGEWVTDPLKPNTVLRFHNKHVAMSLAHRMAVEEWEGIERTNPDGSERMYCISVEPYPLKPVQSTPGQRGIGVGVRR